MRTLVLAGPLVGLLAACGGDTPATSTGSLVFTPPAGTAADALLASEADVIRGPMLLDHVRQDLRGELAPGAITVTRRPGTTILDVAVRHAQPVRAAELCNVVLRSYLELQEDRKRAIREQQNALGAQLDQHPDDAQLAAKMRELEIARTQPDVARVLDSCTHPK